MREKRTICLQTIYVMKNKFCQDKPIFISLSSNTEKDDIVLTLKFLLQPWRWKRFGANQRIDQRESAVKILENAFKNYLGIKHAFAFNSGRTAFLAILNALKLERGREVLLQAFTCNAVVNPILTAGLKPIFVDIDEKTLNIDIFDLEKKISDQSKIVLVQHTFGQPADLEKILAICQKHNLILIEDCAHSLGASYNNQKLGVFGKAAFFSFGRDKVISSVFGGMAATNDEELARKIGEYQGSLPEPSYFWIFQQLLHPILTNFLVIPLYNFCGLGKWTLILLQKLKILSKAVQNKEKNGEMPANFAKKMPEALAILALNQLNKLNKILAHQKEIAEYYNKKLQSLPLELPLESPGRIYMRYPIILKTGDSGQILNLLRKQKIFLDDGWRKTPIVPPDTIQEKMGYRAGDCPVAEKVARNIINLPTHINISEEKAQKIASFIKSILK